MAMILVVEDNPETQFLVKSVLAGNEVDVVGSVSEASHRLNQKKYDLMIVDVGLPDGDGFAFVAGAKPQLKTSNTSVIFLTGMTDTAQKVLGFSLGAEDYVTKPFDPIELKVRVDVRLKGVADRSEKDSKFQKGDLIFDLLTHRVRIEAENGASEEVDLTGFEFKLLLYFARHEDHVLNRNQIVAAVWGDNINILDRTIDTHVSRLRKKIASSIFKIHSVYGSGYRFSKG